MGILASSASASASFRGCGVEAFGLRRSRCGRAATDGACGRPLRRGRDNARTDRAPAPVSACRWQRSGAACLLAFRPSGRAIGSDHQPLHGAIGRPHLFEVIELANLGPKDMDDDVAGIDQHPIALGRPFDASAAKAFVFQLFDDLVGDGPDMPLRASRCDHHLVADRGLASQVDGRDLLRLGGIERVEHDLE